MLPLRVHLYISIVIFHERVYNFYLPDWFFLYARLNSNVYYVFQLFLASELCASNPCVIVRKTKPVIKDVL